MPKNPTRTSRWTGAAYLGIVLCGLFAEFFVRGSLTVPGDARATAEAIAASPGFFRLGIGADMLMVGLDVGVAFGLYRILRPIDPRLATAATVARLLQAGVLAVNLLQLTKALSFAQLSTSAPTYAAAALQALESHARMYDVALIPFGIACLILGRLFWLATAPRALAIGLSMTGVVYLAGSFVKLLTFSTALDPFYAISIVVEPAVAIWLMVHKGRMETARETFAAAR
ncbi:MAG: DUF4386 domain-containing protein [Myxococcales bacterium]|nr:DUF4386 domain-containing protein [Myxococcales bacterium]